MKYIDAGYIIGLGVIFLYSVSLIVRRRRLERADRLKSLAVASDDQPLAALSDEIAGSVGAGNGGLHGSLPTRDRG